MATSLEQFLQQLEESGILAGETIQDLIPPKAFPADSEELALELIRRKMLTKYQATEVIKGNGRSLTLGTYVLLERIGVGGMGQVFKARHRRMDRIVAIKLLPAEMSTNAAAIARFEREVIASARLRHPNIVFSEDADCADGVHFLVMEYVEGKDLSALVKKNGPFSVEHAVNFIHQAARGLEAAHAEGIVHRDIKPHNLLLDPHGIIKILDLGLARIGGEVDGPSLAELTSTGAIMGTVDYMAPEQAIDTKSADARADIYSLGCTLHYLLTGRAMYEGDSLMKKLLAHRENAIPLLRAARPEVPQRLDAIFRRMVAKRVHERFQTMTEVLAALESDGPLPDLPPAPGTQASADAIVPDFFKDLSSTSAKSVHKKTAGLAPAKKGQRKLLLAGGVAAGVVLALAGLWAVLSGRDGTLVLSVNEEDAQVQVLDAQGQLKFSRRRFRSPMTLTLSPGIHQLKIAKAGFDDFEQTFTIPAGGRETISATLTYPEETAAESWGKFGEALSTKGVTSFASPEFDKWFANVVMLNPKQKINAVRDKLRALNPGFNGKFNTKIIFGAVSELNLESDRITDLSPLRVFEELVTLHCDASDWTQVELADLSPLRGLKLTTFSCFSASVSDLSPLSGMPLTNLNCSNTNVSDLSALQGMKLTSLSIRKTKVSSLAPLSGMRLKSFDCFDTPVTDLSPLRGAPLTNLTVSGASITDLTPLSGMPLQRLEANGLQAASLSPLKGMPLTHLEMLGASLVSDISPLQDLPLKLIRIDYNPTRDSQILRAIKSLETINGMTAEDFWHNVDAQPRSKS